MWGHLAVSAVVANAIPYTLFAVAEQNVSSSLAGVINATTPLWTVGFALIARTEAKLTTRRIFGVALGFVGVVTILEPWNGTTSGAIGGVIACIAAAASYGLAYVYQARCLTNRGISPLTLTAAQLTTAAVILGIGLPIGGWTIPAPDGLAVVAVLILGVLGTGLALVINFTLIGTEGPTAASVVTYLLPAVALVLGILVLNEPARWTLTLGALLILAGVALARSVQSDRRSARQQR